MSVARHREMRVANGRSIAYLAVALAAGFGALFGGAAAASGNQTATVPDSAEAWYAATPITTCTLPLGCSPTDSTVSPYPAGTLHIGVAAGRETARSYLQPDLGKLPAGATATSGHMVLPVATAATDGTLRPASAELLACLATQPFTAGAAGSTEKPPAVDCLVSSHPTYDAPKSRFDVDLTPFLAAWGHGRAEDGIALIPSPSLVQPGDVWQVTIDGLGRPGPAHVRSTLSYVTTRAHAANPASGAPVHGGTTSAAPPPPAPIPTAVAAGVAPVAPPQVAGHAPPSLAAVQPVAFRRGFQYPLVFLLPLLLVAGTAYFIRLFTRAPA